tara:strand:+ start:6003 stop:6314 length:312 start_codon:yes stop_codon:yes gene_type:complete
MILAFTLSMPNRGSWNGDWSGKEKVFAITKVFRGLDAEAVARALVDKGNVYHNFGDGWGASISIKEVNAAQARKLRATSAGFCGYDWMVRSLAKKGVIEYEEH